MPAPTSKHSSAASMPADVEERPKTFVPTTDQDETLTRKLQEPVGAGVGHGALVAHADPLGLEDPLLLPGKDLIGRVVLARAGSEHQPRTSPANSGCRASCRPPYRPPTPPTEVVAEEMVRGAAGSVNEPAEPGTSGSRTRAPDHFFDNGSPISERAVRKRTIQLLRSPGHTTPRNPGIPVDGASY